MGVSDFLGCHGRRIPTVIGEALRGMDALAGVWAGWGGAIPGVLRPAGRGAGGAQSAWLGAGEGEGEGAASTVSPAIFHWPSAFTQSSCLRTVSR